MLKESTNGQLTSLIYFQVFLVFLAVVAVSLGDEAKEVVKQEEAVEEEPLQPEALKQGEPAEEEFTKLVSKNQNPLPAKHEEKRGLSVISGGIQHGIYGYPMILGGGYGIHGGYGGYGGYGGHGGYAVPVILGGYGGIGYGQGGLAYGQGGLAYGGIGGQKVITVTKEVGVPVPTPVPVPVVKNVEVPVPHPVAVPVDKPYPFLVPKPFPVPVAKPVPVPVDRPVPFPVKVPVPHPVPFPHPYPVQVPVSKPVVVGVPIRNHVGQGLIVPRPLPCGPGGYLGGGLHPFGGYGHYHG
ncbi:hypothetical protein J437_LFUL010081 [Ladona fulva]|uniref:Uncharacterized protein n=1 Tax=Ladona fulva TaxID=123851 RepID=A0A8K0P3Q7_LADFU|nr:hypothetical protein J437_LFUL010081 [Ladona fulva]